LLILRLLLPRLCGFSFTDEAIVILVGQESRGDVRVVHLVDASLTESYPLGRVWIALVLRRVVEIEV
jgi:hypothetical protein